MNTLLSLFTKASLKLGAQFFLGGLLALLTIKLFPKLELEKDSSLIGGFIYFVGPAVFYFNSRVSVSSSLGWILLTPTKKSHIVIANGLINILKAFLILIAADTLYFIHTLDTKDILLSFLFHPSPLPSGASETSLLYKILTESAMNIYLVIFIVTVPILIFFSMAKSNKLRSSSDYRFPKKIMSLKFFLYFIGVLASISLFISYGDVIYQEVIVKHFPSLFGWSFLYSGIVVAFVTSTLDAIRFSDKKSQISIKTFFGIFVSMSLLLGIYAYKDISSKTTSINDKLNSFPLLGPDLFGSTDKLVSEMKTGSKDLADISPYDVIHFFAQINKSSIEDIQKAWINLCNERKDFICRYAAITLKEKHQKTLRLDLLRLSCPNDLNNCLMLLSYTDDSKEKAALENRFETNCKDTKSADNIVKKACLDYDKEKEKRKSRGTKQG